MSADAKASVTFAAGWIKSSDYLAIENKYQHQQRIHARCDRRLLRVCCGEYDFQREVVIIYVCMDSRRDIRLVGGGGGGG
jgi:hypothetical protein